MKNLLIHSTWIIAAALWSLPSWSATPPTKKTASHAARTVSRAIPARTAPVARRAVPTANAENAQAAALSAAAMNRAPASVRGGGTQDISEELKIMGQSRNLSMGLLFQKDKDKLTFGTPRTNYQDKISDKSANF